MRLVIDKQTGLIDNFKTNKIQKACFYWLDEENSVLTFEFLSGKAYSISAKLYKVIE